MSIGFTGIHSAFRERVDTSDDPVAAAVVWMLGYRLIVVDDQSARARYGPFAPEFEIQGRVFPPNVSYHRVKATGAGLLK